MTEHHCIYCNYKTDRSNSYMRHLVTKIHERRKLFYEEKKKKKEEVDANKYKCENCDKIYKSRCGLWRHKKLNKCKPKLTIRNLDKRVRDLNKKIKNLEGTVTFLVHVITHHCSAKDLKYAKDKFLAEGGIICD